MDAYLHLFMCIWIIALYAYEDDFVCNIRLLSKQTKFVEMRYVEIGRVGNDFIFT